MPTLRPIQAVLERDVYAAWNQGALNVMPVAATGFGKTVVLSKFMLDEPGGSIAIAHRQELVSQISTALARNGVRHRVVGAKKGSPLIRVISAIQTAELGYSYLDANAKAGVGGVDTVIRMDPNDPFFKQVRLKVQDEAHHVLKTNKWGTADGMFPHARGLYPTATPRRADGKGLGRHTDGLVDAMVLAPSMREVINMGYLTDYRIFAPPSDFSLQGVDVSDATGDFNKDQLTKARKRSHITGDAVSHYLKYAKGKLGVVFDTDVESAGETAAAFRNAGIPAEVVSAKTPDAVRAQILRRFKNRELLILVNVDLFGEGFDLPSIECVFFLRATQSFALFVQQFGRALRLMLPPEWFAGYDDLTDEGRRALIAASDKPVAFIFDHVSNVLRHGLPDARQDWDLERREKRSAKKSDAIPLRVCLNPECVQPYERVYKCCPYCGHYPPPPSRSAPEFVDGDLTELDAEALRVLRGEVDKIVQPFSGFPGMPADKAYFVRQGHETRRETQLFLRNSIAWWAGLEAAQGRGESESYRRFFHRFGIDVATAQTLSTSEARDLMTRVNGELLKYGIDGTVNAGAYFANQLS